MDEITTLVYHLYIYYTVIHLIWEYSKKLYFFIITFDFTPLYELVFKLYELYKNFFR